MTTTPVYPPAPARGASGLLGGVTARLRSVEAWLDAKGRYAWITAMVLGFIAFWPIGLFLVAYITFTNRWSKSAMFGTPATRSAARDWATTGTVLRPSGNTAFDAYKAETLRRLEEEQQAFEAFLERLRAAKDKSEFDAFMEDRSRGAKPVATEDTRSET
ncbi:MAG: DUF2852 domain-containing protein [Cypionkella sp.]|jgi:hypothetical protein|nr:DUF2852 domain-containing protein [Cypionkella sp.]